MEDSWANRTSCGGSGGGSDLYLDLTGTGGTGGLRASLIRALRDAVRSGRLVPGTRLPPSRSLAADLGVARNTVADAYGELVAEGWLHARQGSGTRVAQRADPGPRPKSGSGAGTWLGTRPGPKLSPYARSRAAAEAGVVYGDAPDGRGGAAHPVHDLRTGSPDVSAFPRQAWLTSARRALTAAPADAFGHGDLRGRPELRRALAGYLARARGVRAEPERIVICAGLAQGLSLLARVLPGETAVEEYGLRFHRGLLESAGTTIRPLSVDAHGARTAELARLPSVRAVLLTPAHQFPTGVPLHPERRADVIDWARRGDGLVLEDDYDGEFRYDRQPVGALQSLDPERVGYLGTASKSLAPALRLAWMVLPAHLVEAVLAAKTPAEWVTAVPDQLTLADLIDSGAYDPHVRAMRQRYRRRRDRLVATLAERAPRVRVTGIAAGLHAILELPHGADELAVRNQAARRGLAFDTLTGFRHPEPPAATDAANAIPRPSLVIGYGTPSEHAFPGALDALCGVLREALGAA